MGLDYVEIGVGEDVSFDPHLTADRAHQLRLELVLSPGGLWPDNCDVSSADPVVHQRGIDWHRRALDLCAAVRAVAYTGAIYGHPGTVLRQDRPEECYGRVAEGLRILADHAQGLGVELAIEPMSRFRTHVCNTPEQAVHLVGMVNHNNLYVLLDTWHMVNEVRDYAAAVELCGKRLWGIHASASDRGVPGGDLVPWDDLSIALRDMRLASSTEGGRCLRVGLESYNTSLHGGRFARSRGVFQAVCPDGDDFVRRSLAFLRPLVDNL